MKKSIIDHLFTFIHWSLETLEDLFRCLTFRKPRKVSLLARNILWFTECSWIDQLIKFDQLGDFLYKGKQTPIDWV